MATLKTAGVKSLVDEVVADLPRPLTEHVTLAVFKEIERSPTRLNEYHALCNELRQSVVNNWIGEWTRRALGADSIKEVGAEGTTLAKNYSLLRFRSPHSQPANGHRMPDNACGRHCPSAINLSLVARVCS